MFYIIRICLLLCFHCCLESRNFSTNSSNCSHVHMKVVPNGSFVINKIKTDPRHFWSHFLYSIISCGQPCPQGFSLALGTSLDCAVH